MSFDGDGNDCTTVQPDKKVIFLWKNADFDIIADNIFDYNWYEIVRCAGSANDMWSIFCNILVEAIASHAPSISNCNRNKNCKHYPCNVKKALTLKTSQLERL